MSCRELSNVGLRMILWSLDRRGGHLNLKGRHLCSDNGVRVKLQWIATVIFCTFSSHYLCMFIFLHFLGTAPIRHVTASCLLSWQPFSFWRKAAETVSRHDSDRVNIEYYFCNIRCLVLAHLFDAVDMNPSLCLIQFDRSRPNFDIPFHGIKPGLDMRTVPRIK